MDAQLKWKTTTDNLGDNKQIEKFWICLALLGKALALTQKSSCCFGMKLILYIINEIVSV